MNVPPAVATVLHALETGDWTPVKDVLAPDVVYDASVPEWHFSMAGADDVLAELATTTEEHPWRFHELRTTRTDKGVLAEMEMRGRCPGHEGHPPHEEASRNALVFELTDDGLLSEIRLICSGQWGEDVIERIEAEAPRVR
jgi:hypothetical protein